VAIRLALTFSCGFKRKRCLFESGEIESRRIPFNLVRDFQDGFEVAAFKRSFERRIVGLPARNIAIPHFIGDLRREVCLHELVLTSFRRLGKGGCHFFTKPHKSQVLSIGQLLSKAYPAVYEVDELDFIVRATRQFFAVG
jgi:hypothetical protein